MSLEGQIENLLTPPLEALGLGIVRIAIHGGSRRVVEILIERLDDQPVKVSDCVRANKESSAFLDVEDLVKGAYVLDVSSPGLDRPLMKPKDYKRFVGRDIKLETYTLMDNQRKFVGKLHQADDEGFVLIVGEDSEKQEVDFKYVDIRKAKLVPDLDI